MDYKKFIADCERRRKEIKALRAKKVPVSWNDIAARYGISRQRAQQIAGK
jgi:predicted ArsR family transcriptional regulator